MQQRMLEVVAQWSGVPAEDMSTAVDGCGVMTFALPLQRRFSLKAEGREPLTENEDR